MYARSNTIRGNPDKLDGVIAYCRDEVMPLVRGLPGCIGLSMLADRESGRCIVTTAWDSEESMHASDQAVRASRSRAGQMADAQAEVEEWEVALMHRVRESPEGACVRMIWLRGDPARADDARETMRAMLPRMEELPGFCSVSSLVNRRSGVCAAAVTYESRDAMRGAAEAGRAIRDEVTRQAGMQMTEVAEFDLALAHLRVPEMA